jgi:hypothetical protein
MYSGLAPMVSFFQWAMSTILIASKDFAFVYLDDVVIGGNTKEEVSQRLHAVLQRLHDLNRVVAEQYARRATRRQK